MLHTYQGQIEAILVIFVCGLALINGRWRERLAAVLYLATAAVITVAWLHHAQWLFFAADLSYLIVLLSLCWKSPHPWPLWALLFQSACTACHIAFLNHIQRWTFIEVEAGASFGVLVALAAGTLAAMHDRWRQRRKSEN